MPTELMFPMSTRVPPIDWRGVPSNVYQRFRNSVSAVCRTQQEAEDLVKWFGNEGFCPFKPVLLMIPGTGGVLLCGAGYATASELRDDAVGLWVLKSEKVAKTGSLFDFDSLREKARLPRREEVKDAVCEAFAERIKRHKQNMRTDPPRVPRYVRPNGKMIYAVDGSKIRRGGKKETSDDSEPR